MKNSFILFTLVCLAAYAECNGGLPEPFMLLRKSKESRQQDNLLTENLVSKEDLPIYVGRQGGRRKHDKIGKLPGQPYVKFNQYSGHVTVDPKAGRALFYYFAEAENPKEKPLVLWLNGGPGCSSMGGGAMTELGPFRVNPDGKTLWYNEYAWNKVANVIFLESPAGVGFSYSNRSSDYVTGDKHTAADSYAFLLNWFERFPEYKTQEFFLTGESYAGHFIPQLAELILSKNKNTTHTIIKLKGIALGNALVDDADWNAGMYDYLWTHALISDETHSTGNIDPYDIYAPLCLNSSTPTTPSGISRFDPCSLNYVDTYLNTKDVQKALHADVAGINRRWELCNAHISWKDCPETIIPVIKKLMCSGIRILIYSGDTDAVVPVTATKYSLLKLGARVTTKWYPWYYQGEVGGYAVGYDKNLTFVTVRGAGHMVPSYQPGPALTLFTSFLHGKLPPHGK